MENKDTTKPQGAKKSQWLEALWNLLRGIPIGIANIIPGVSGGTIGVMLGIYDKLIGSISNFRKDIKGNLKFLVPILLGVAVGVGAFAVLLKEVLFAHYEMQTVLFFLGLIAGSVPMIIRNSEIKRLSLRCIIPFVIAFAIMIILPILEQASGGGSGAFELNVLNAFVMGICGIIASVTMIIPGISGSMMLTVIGYYDIVLNSVSGFVTNLLAGQIILNEVLILLFFGIGAVTGIIGGAKVIDICLKKVRVETYAVIIGLVVGSLYQIYLESGFASNGFGSGEITAIISCIVGAAIALFFGSKWLARITEKLAARNK